MNIDLLSNHLFSKAVATKGVTIFSPLKTTVYLPLKTIPVKCMLAAAAATTCVSYVFCP